MNEAQARQDLTEGKQFAASLEEIQREIFEVKETLAHLGDQNADEVPAEGGPELDQLEKEINALSRQVDSMTDEEFVEKLQKVQAALVKAERSVTETQKSLDAPATEGLVERARQALVDFEAPFQRRRFELEAKIGSLEALGAGLERGVDKAVYGGDKVGIAAAEKNVSSHAAELAKARRELKVASGWRARERVKLQELNAKIIEAYQAELQTDHAAVDASRARIAEGKKAYIALVVEHYKLLHAAGEKIADGYHDYSLFPVPSFRNLDRKDQEVSMEEIAKTAGKPWSAPVYFAGLQTYGKGVSKKMG